MNAPFPARLATRLEPTPRSRHPLRILLAEDQPVNQRLALRILETWGHSVVVVGNGKLAVAAWEQNSFDLILMDMQMPEMGGLEATGVIRGKEASRSKRVLIFAMTAQAMSGDRERCLAAGMDGYISKPIDPEQLFITIEGVPRC